MVDGYIFRGSNPAGIWCENDVVLTSMRRDYVASTLIRRHFGTKCPLGTLPSSFLPLLKWGLILRGTNLYEKTFIGKVPSPREEKRSQKLPLLKMVENHGDVSKLSNRF